MPGSEVGSAPFDVAAPLERIETGGDVQPGWSVVDGVPAAPEPPGRSSRPASHPAILSAATALGMTGGQLDELFLLGSTL
jgi:hypothetical protein